MTSLSLIPINNEIEWMCNKNDKGNATEFKIFCIRGNFSFVNFCSIIHIHTGRYKIL